MLACVRSTYRLLVCRVLVALYSIKSKSSMSSIDTRITVIQSSTSTRSSCCVHASHMDTYARNKFLHARPCSHRSRRSHRPTKGIGAIGDTPTVCKARTLTNESRYLTTVNENDRQRADAHVEYWVKRNSHSNEGASGHVNHMQEQDIHENVNCTGLDLRISEGAVSAAASHLDIQSEVGMLERVEYEMRSTTARSQVPVPPPLGPSAPCAIARRDIP